MAWGEGLRQVRGCDHAALPWRTAAVCRCPGRSHGQNDKLAISSGLVYLSGTGQSLFNQWVSPGDIPMTFSPNTHLSMWCPRFRHGSNGTFPSGPTVSKFSKVVACRIIHGFRSWWFLHLAKLNSCLLGQTISSMIICQNASKCSSYVSHCIGTYGFLVGGAKAPSPLAVCRVHSFPAFQIRVAKRIGEPPSNPTTYNCTWGRHDVGTRMEGVLPTWSMEPTRSQPIGSFEFIKTDGWSSVSGTRCDPLDP